MRRLLALNLVVLLGCVAISEAVCHFLNRPDPSGFVSSDAYRKYRWDLPDERNSNRAPSAFRLKATLGELPVVNPTPVLPTHAPEKARTDLRLLVGWGLRPNIVARMWAEHPTKGMLYDIPIHTDSVGRREAPLPKPGRRSRHALVFGCSFAFGAAIEDHETLAAQLGRFAPKYRGYNYGIPGAGPNEVVERIASRDLRSEVAEEEGVGIYLFIPDHVRRIPPSISSLSNRANAPYYHEGPDGSIVRAPTFAGAFPIGNAFYGLLARSETLRYLQVDYPMSLGTEQMRRAARITRKMADEYRRQFPKGEFRVVLYPTWPLMQPYTRFLEEYGVKYLDYSGVDLPKLTKKSAFVTEHDWHPSAEANRLLARQVAVDLELVR